MSLRIPATDLTQRPPRTPRQRLGGYVILPRMLDKGRATLAKTHGEYHYDSTTDRRFTGFVGIDGEALSNSMTTPASAAVPDPVIDLQESKGGNGW